MKIIIGEHNIDQIQEKYIVLELDKISAAGMSEPVSSYCLVDQAPLQDLLEMQQWKELHDNLIRNYRLKNWNYCVQAIEHLRGHWGGDLDSFYDDLAGRVGIYLEQDPGDSWSYVLQR
jgi:hypothetical protein